MHGGRPTSGIESDLSALLAARGRLLVLLDFDGTLSPIAPTLDKASIVPSARRALRRLAAVSAARPDRLTLAFLSGRTVRDVATRVRVGGIRYLGIHGVESGALLRGRRPETIEVVEDPALAAYTPLMESIAASVVRRIPESWLLVEPKGPNVAFHYRLASDTDAARERLLAAIAGAIEEATAAEAEAGDSPGADAGPAAGDTRSPNPRVDARGISITEGRKVIELRPVSSALGKAAAVERLIDELRPAAVLALGDDRPDAEGFELLREAREKGELHALIVAVEGREETPRQLLDVADSVVSSPAAAARLLGNLAAALERETE